MVLLINDNYWLRNIITVFDSLSGGIEERLGVDEICLRLIKYELRFGDGFNKAFISQLAELPGLYFRIKSKLSDFGFQIKNYCVIATGSEDV